MPASRRPRSKSSRAHEGISSAESVDLWRLASNRTSSREQTLAILGGAHRLPDTRDANQTAYVICHARNWCLRNGKYTGKIRNIMIPPSGFEEGGVTVRILELGY